MGERKNKRQRFFAGHPRCCFCGGGVAATTVDHIPSRGFFLDRLAPEKYEFPACEYCQSVSANLEQLVAFVCKLSMAEGSAKEQADFRERAKAIRNNFRDVYDSLLYPAAKAKRLVRERGIQLPPGMLASEAPIANLNHPKLLSAVRIYAQKLFLALHYLHVKTILPSSGAMLYAWYTNVHRMQGKTPTDVIKDLKGVPRIQRRKVTLSDQFNYRYGIEPSAGISAFFVSLGDSIAMMGVVLPNPELHDIPSEMDILRPFNRPITVTTHPA